MDERTYRRLIAKAFGKAQKEANRRTYKCLFPSCSGMAIKSHSQQRSGALAAIAENGLIYSVQRNHYQVMKQLPTAPVMVLTGVSEASTFDGFCALHDRSLFAPIENKPLIPYDREQTFLLYLRSVCYEFANKRRMRDWILTIKGEVKDFASRHLIDHLDTTEEARNIFLTRDGGYYLDLLFRDLESRSFERISDKWITIDKNVGASCSCVLSPLLEEHNQYMAEHWTEPQPLISFSLIPISPTGVTYLVAAWLRDVEHLCSWVHSDLESDANLEAFLNKCAFEESEDTCVRPSLWESLSSKDRSEAEKAMMPTHVRGPLERTPTVIRI